MYVVRVRVVFKVEYSTTVSDGKRVGVMSICETGRARL